MPARPPDDAPRRTPGGEALTELILRIFRTNDALQAIGAQVTRDPDIVAVRWRMLSALRGEPKTAARLGRELGVSRQGALLNVRMLQDLGLVELVDNPADQRAMLVALTAGGEAKLAQVSGHQAVWVNALARQFRRADVDAALDLLARLEEAARASVQGGGEGA